jgi:hypothetical protein
LRVVADGVGHGHQLMRAAILNKRIPARKQFRHYAAWLSHCSPRQPKSAGLR